MCGLSLFISSIYYFCVCGLMIFFVVCLSSFLFYFCDLLYVFDLWLPWSSRMLTHDYPSCKLSHTKSNIKKDLNFYTPLPHILWFWCPSYIFVLIFLLFIVVIIALIAFLLFLNLHTDLFNWSSILLYIDLSYCDFPFPIECCFSFT